MIPVSIKRVFSFSWQHFWRNIWLSIATMMIIVLTLFSLTTLVLVNAIVDRTVNSVAETVDVSLYFDNEITEEAIELLQTELENIEEIKEIIYISPAAALEKFRVEHLNDETIQASLAELEENPLGATLILKAYNVDSYPVIMKKIAELQAETLAEEIDYDDHQILISRIDEFGSKIKNFGLILSLIFIVIALLTVFNTIRMGIYVHRKEITIMRLVGANNWFIRLPFILEGLLYAVLSCILFWLALFTLLHFMGPWINGLLAGIDFNINSYISSNIINILGFEFIVIALINTLSAVIAMGRYLRT